MSHIDLSSVHVKNRTKPTLFLHCFSPNLSVRPFAFSLNHHSTLALSISTLLTFTISLDVFGNRFTLVLLLIRGHVWVWLSFSVVLYLIVHVLLWRERVLWELGFPITSDLRPHFITSSHSHICYPFPTQFPYFPTRDKIRGHQIN